jgi:predicted alpha/beta-hydrolase family hydrolase
VEPGPDGIVLTHGASSNARAPLLVALADAFTAKGLTVFRYDLPFRQARPTGPPSPGGAARDREGLRGAVQSMRASVAGRVFLGGHSYGGRQASILAADHPGLADALLLLSYPLHPPGRPAQLRTAHFGDLRTIGLFVHGSADPFGSLDELESARRLIPVRTALLTVDGTGHDLLRGRRLTVSEFADGIAAAFLEFSRTHAP